MNGTGISPKVGVWCNFIAVICTGVAAGAVQFGSLSPAVVGDIKTLALDAVFLISSANLVFHLYSAPTSGPMVSK